MYADNRFAFNFLRIVEHFRDSFTLKVSISPGCLQIKSCGFKCHSDYRISGSCLLTVVSGLTRIASCGFKCRLD